MLFGDRGIKNRRLKLICVFLTTYIVMWFLSYSIIMMFDFHYLLEYFIFGFTGGGELPTFIQFFCFGVFSDNFINCRHRSQNKKELTG